MVKAARKTRLETNAELAAINNARKIPRVTENPYTFQKACAEFEARDFVIAPGAEAFWNRQTCIMASRKMMVKDDDHQRLVVLRKIISGTAISANAKKALQQAKCEKRSATTIARGLGQKHWMEGAGIAATMKILDPENLLDVVPLIDGVSSDFGLQIKGENNGLVPVQMKTAEWHDGALNFNVRQEDGLGTGRYPGMILLCAAFTFDHAAALEQQKEFNVIPDVAVKEIYLYETASDIHGTVLYPHPRRARDDDYGDNRFVFGFDDMERLKHMRVQLLQMVKTSPKQSWEALCCTFGPGTSNPRTPWNHQEEMLNVQALGQIVGFDSLEAPALQNQTTDIIWNLDKKQIKISIKTASHSDGGYTFQLCKAPSVEFCDIVMAFYRDGERRRTHVSVFRAQNVYVANKHAFRWSPTLKPHILENRIDIQQDGAREKLEHAVNSL
jgi:hypothetical protein